jgi:hypothetical protein
MCLPQSVETIKTADNFFLYPNPTDESLIINSQGYNTYEINNTLGQLMTQGQLQNGETKINVKALPAGMYYIQLNGGNVTKAQKFQKL